jgi:hypothetical protein
MLLVAKAEEELMMRPVAPGERPCRYGAACRGARLAAGDILPAFRHWPFCVLCLRADTTRDWLRGLGQSKPAVIQPYRVAIAEGEYALEACLTPVSPRFDGICDPFPRYTEDRLFWCDGRLRQCNMDFQRVPSLRGPAPVLQQFPLRRLPLMDATPQLLRAGLLAPRAPATEPGILRSMQQALHEAAPQLNPESTWLQALRRYYLPAQPAGGASQGAVLEFIVDAVADEPLLLEAARALHDWDAFARLVREHMQGLREGAPPPGLRPALACLRHLPEPPEGGAVLEVPLPAHWLTPPRADRDVQFVCLSCRAFKGTVVQPGEPLTAYGQTHVAYSLADEEYRCFRRKGGGCLAGDITRVQFRGNLVESPFAPPRRH